MTAIYPELTDCHICPRHCGIDRYQAQGFCRASAEVEINLAQLHHGEEPVLSGTRGSGTIFFSHCNLQCVFCQNYRISALGWGKPATSRECVQMMLDLQDKGAHNINLVTPTHYSLQLADILTQAKEHGLHIPIVWNSNAYETVDTLKRLEGLVDIYLPDLKYAHGVHAGAYSAAKDYPQLARQAISEMHRQVGNLVTDKAGIAIKGLIVRMLVLPNRLAGVSDSLRWIYDNLGNQVYLSIMAQYYPAWKAAEFPQINRGITAAEYDDVLQTVHSLGFERGFLQELSCTDAWTPVFAGEQ